MKKMIVLLFTYLIFNKVAFAGSNVGPEIWLTGNLINNSSLYMGYQLVFSAYNQDVLNYSLQPQEYGKINYSFLVQLIQGGQATWTLSYNNMATLRLEPLCDFAIAVDQAGKASVKATDVIPNLIHCAPTGDPNGNNFTITLADGFNN